MFSAECVGREELKSQGNWLCTCSPQQISGWSFIWKKSGEVFISVVLFVLQLKSLDDLFQFSSPPVRKRIQLKLAGCCFFFCFFKVLLLSKNVLKVTPVSFQTHLHGNTAEQERRRKKKKSCFSVHHFGLQTPTNFFLLVPNKPGRRRPVAFACFLFVDCTDFFFQCYLCFFSFISLTATKKEKRNMKKNHKRFLKVILKKTVSL